STHKCGRQITQRDVQSQTTLDSARTRRVCEIPPTAVGGWIQVQPTGPDSLNLIALRGATADWIAFNFAITRFS
ncbi:MAG TPA: hypothetical protein VIK24_10915, partial [Pyrinomonadaceae bacterium]